MSTVIFTFPHGSMISVALLGNEKRFCWRTIFREFARLFRLCISHDNDKDLSRAKQQAPCPSAGLANPSIHLDVVLAKSRIKEDETRFHREQPHLPTNVFVFQQLYGTRLCRMGLNERGCVAMLIGHGCVAKWNFFKYDTMKVYYEGIMP